MQGAKTRKWSVRSPTLRPHRAPDLSTSAVSESARTCFPAPAPPPVTQANCNLTLHKTIGARAHDREQIPFAHFPHLAIKREKIARFTHRADYVNVLCLTRNLALARLFDRHNFMIAMEKRWGN